MMQPLQAERVEHVVVIRVVAELHVTADVPREAAVVDDAGSQSTGSGSAIEENVIGVPELLQPVCGAESGRSGADDDDAAGIVHGKRRIATVAVSMTARMASGAMRRRLSELLPVRRAT